jgi:hypothetical protein
MVSIASAVQSPRSLLEGVEAIACSVLAVAALRHRSALRGLTGSEGEGLVQAIFDALADNYRRGGASANKDRSQANWRWCSLQPKISVANPSPEVGLEREIAKACEAAGRMDWANQIPVASGLILGAADRRRAIDLVHRRGDGHFEFIELKIASDTPLYASVEIIGYACLWLLARADPPTRSSELLVADKVDLRVLAPARYYDGFDLEWLETRLDSQAKALGRAHGVHLSFAFDVLPPALCVAGLPDHDDLLNELAVRAPLFHRPAA